MNSYAENFRTSRASIKSRPLSPQEIETLEKNGNRCEDWSQISVDPAFTPNRTSGSSF